MKAELINPFVGSTVSVFSTMLGCELKRGQLSLNDKFQHQYDISGIIGLSGPVSGTVVVSLDEKVALAATRVMLGDAPDTVNEEVVDAVGELTNMIAGSAKSQLAQFCMSLALPTVITGKNHVITFGSRVRPVCIPFESQWGPLTVEVGLLERE